MPKSQYAEIGSTVSFWVSLSSSHPLLEALVLLLWTKSLAHHPLQPLSLLSGDSSLSIIFHGHN